MTFNIVGLVAIVVFYVLILLVGIWAGRKSKKSSGEPGETEEMMLAGRNIGAVVGIFTMTATWVGGGYINGTAEVVYTQGLIWCQAPFGYALSLVLGGLFFAEKMRNEGYVTMLDPFQLRYGERMGGLLFLPALAGETFWSAAILSALGATLTVILDIRPDISIILSACIAVFYTFFGGLYSVAYTDVVQLFCIFIGLWICIPAAWLNEHVGDVSSTQHIWTGLANPMTTKDILVWIDCALLLVFGGIPWQVYFQRVLSSRTAADAKMLSYVAAVGCIIMAIPSVLIGCIATATDWNATGYFPYSNGTGYNAIPHEFRRMTLPLVLQYLTPIWVSFVGLGAVSAAVMSSADSSVLGAASMFARNIYKMSIRPGASEREMLIVMRVTIVVVGILATIMALTIESIYELWYLCGDLVYVMLFPQLVLVVYMPKANTYGSLSGFIVGFLLRFLGGEKTFRMPAVIKYGQFYDEDTEVNMFPFKTLSMLASMLTIIFVSLITHELFTRGILPPKLDLFQCIVNIPQDRLLLKDSSSRAQSTDTLAMYNLKVNYSENGGVTNPLLMSARTPDASEASFRVPEGSHHGGAPPPPVFHINEERAPLQSPYHQGRQQNFNYESMHKEN